ncbi:hypothetical protein [Brevibacillus agri]|uniref:hypothetical protein n=1 Tax=Brevibacillus agri TaxID=51101 RepID=UPI0012DFA776|nr:hypothetical protein [Brevibacillus agri]
MGLSRHYVWQCDYGNGEPVIPIFKVLLDEQDYSQLESLQMYINNNPYNLEFYTVLTYDNPTEGQIERMKNLMVNEGVRYRPDITMDELLRELAHRSFNCLTISS